MAKPVQRRKRKLINPAFQLKLVGVFVGLAGASILLQLFLLGIDLRRVAQAMPEGALLEMEIPRVITRSLMFTLGMWLPVTVAIGIVVTHTIAGPVFRFEQHLKGVAEGKRMGQCRIREGDEFQELCRLINAALQEAYRTDPSFLDGGGDTDTKVLPSMQDTSTDSRKAA